MNSLKNNDMVAEIASQNHNLKKKMIENLSYHPFQKSISSSIPKVHSIIHSKNLFHHPFQKSSEITHSKSPFNHPFERFIPKNSFQMIHS